MKKYSKNKSCKSARKRRQKRYERESKYIPFWLVRLVSTNSLRGDSSYVDVSATGRFIFLIIAEMAGFCRFFLVYVEND